MKEDDENSRKIVRAAHSLIGNHHPNLKAVLAVVFAEMLAFGRQYAQAIIENARALGKSMYDRGFDVLCPEKGFTQSHQVLISNKISSRSTGLTAREVGEFLDRANIITDVSVVPNREWNTRGPPILRFGTAEITRLGMVSSEMDHIASLCERLVLRREDPTQIAKEVSGLMKEHQKIHFCFDESAQAYEYYHISKIADD